MILWFQFESFGEQILKILIAKTLLRLRKGNYKFINFIYTFVLNTAERVSTFTLEGSGGM